MSRQLATIQTIESVITHPNADSLQLAKVLGWTVVIRTEEFLPGQKVIYLEIDSLIPVTATWIPLPLQQRIITEKITEHYRVKTMKIRREFSQGLCIAIPADLSHLEVGTDVTDILGITKYCNDAHEIYESNGGNFPTHLISYTDEVRIQSRPKIIERISGLPYYISVKIDGTSATYAIDPVTSEFIVCSRAQRRAYTDKCVYHQAAIAYKIREILLNYSHFVVQGEVYGPKIQKNLLNAKKISFAVFTVKNLNTGNRLTQDEMVSWCNIVGLPTVQIIETGDAFQYNVSQLFELAKGQYSGTKNMQEGIVIRSYDQTISFKVINNEFLLKHE